jgi:glucosamine-6-phosphate deaminase
MKKNRKYNNSSVVEHIALKRSGRKSCYAPTEKIDVVEVRDFPSLGKLTSLRFIEWMQQNPQGVISLPTGKTPEFFIKWTTSFLNNWDKKEVAQELEKWGIDVTQKPDIDSFHFVQIDEFYPMNPEQENSFAHYINKFYFKEFGLNRKRALLMDAWNIGAPNYKNLGDIFPYGKIDLSLRFRSPESELEQAQQDAIIAIDQFAMEYEEKIRNLGGIGFFLGGIGPDGHIGFNVKGADHFSTTRLSQINYETAAAAAGDLGGIENSRTKLVMTIGLQTIVENENATAIIIAAGESKAQIIKDSIESEVSVTYPATSLQSLKGARFYLTKGAASLLQERRLQDLKSKKIDEKKCEQILIDVAKNNHKQLEHLTTKDLKEDCFGSILIDNKIDIQKVCATTHNNLRIKINNGLNDFVGKRFLHTAPHHDDIMLGYLPYIVHLVRNFKSSHYFATMTSGFTSVTNNYTLQQLDCLEGLLKKGVFDSFIKQGYFSLDKCKQFCGCIDGRNGDVYHYLDGIAANNVEKQKRSESCRMLRNLAEIFKINLNNKKDLKQIYEQIKNLKEYFAQGYPGKKDSPDVQNLKGMIREWEEELLWGHLGFNCDHIYHLRLGFYTGDIFTQQPEFERDAKPILNLLEELNPDIVTVALDPEGSGPDTHYKVLQATAQAIKAYLKKHPAKNLQIWGYRNVWYRFLASEANIFVPVSMNSLAILKQAFLICFGSQRQASFPSYEYDGPFCDLAQKIMVEQYNILRTCLGEDYFYKNPIPRQRATRGFCFLRAMNAQEFFETTDALKKYMEIKN